MTSLPMRVSCVTWGADMMQTMASQCSRRACKASSTGRKWSSMNSMVTMTMSACAMALRQAAKALSLSRQDEALCVCKFRPGKSAARRSPAWVAALAR